MSLDILFVISELSPSKVSEATFFNRLCTQFSKAGTKIAALTSQGLSGSVKKESLFPIYDVIPKWTWKEKEFLTNFIIDKKPKKVVLIFFASSYDRHPMIMFLPKIIKKRDSKIKFVTIFPNEKIPYFIPNLPRFISFFIRGIAKHLFFDYRYGFLLKKSDFLISFSKHQRDCITRNKKYLLNKSSVVVAPPVEDKSEVESLISSDELRKCYQIDSKKLVITYFGFIYPGKGVEHLIDALKILLDKGNDGFILIIIGDIIKLNSRQEGISAYIKKIKQQIKSLNLEKYVIWTGFIDDKREFLSHLNFSDISVMPFDKGIGLNNGSYSTIASFGVPVVATKGECTTKEFLDEKSVFLCKPKSPQEISEKIEYFMNNPNYIPELKKSAIDFVKTNYSWKKILDLINSI